MTSFYLNDKEVAAATAWKKQHEKDHVVNYSGAIGGRWSYIFTPTSIGVCIKIQCSCGEFKDITDFENF